MVLPPPMQSSLPAGWLAFTGRESNPLDRFERFPMFQITFSFPLSSGTITTLEACIADLRSLLAKAEERAADERSRCDRLIAETLAANARAAHLEGELTALRSRPAPWWRRWRQANRA
jgi:hypothetical protein